MNGAGGPVVRHLEVTRTARYVLVGDEDRPPAELWVVLHGYRQLAGRFLRPFHGLATTGRWIVAPEALNRFYLDDGSGRHGPDARVGATWMTRDDREADIGDYVRYLDRLHTHLVEGLDSLPALGVLGFSQGAHTAARWATLGSVPPARVVLWGAYLPDDLDPERASARLGRTDLVMVQGASDPHRDPELEARQEDRLRALGLDPTRIEHGGGHELEPERLRDVLRIGR